MLLAPVLVLALAARACTETESQQPDRPPLKIREGGTHRPDTLTVGVTPYLSSKELEQEYKPLVTYLGEALGLPSELRFPKTYAGLSKMLLDNEVDVAILSPFNYVRAKQENPSLILLAAPIADGSATYAAYIITHENTGITDIAGLRGKRFGFVDRRSASGYLLPLGYLLEGGYPPETFFREVVYAGNHSRLIEQVATGEIDAGATYSIAFESAHGHRLRILAKTGRVPLDAYCASPRLAQDLIDKLREALLNLSTRTEAGKKVLHESHINGFVLAKDDLYDDLRRVAALVDRAEKP